MPLTTETNLWLPVALLLTGRIFLLGFAWSWLMPSVEDRTGKWLIHGVQPLVFGIPVLLTIRLISAEVVFLPAFTPEFLTVLGLSAGLIFRRQKLLDRIKPIGLVFLIASMGSTVIMHLPNRSEWIVGGWDPGIYVNEGVNLARIGTYQHQADPFFSQLSEEELEIFTRIRLNYQEAHPVVILDPESRAMKRFFFPLTSTLIAEYTKAGGIRAAVRTNYFLGLFVVMVFAALLCAYRMPPLIIVTTTLVLMGQPVWLYHLNIPTSEMLQLFFVCALGLLIPHLRSHPTALFGFGHIMLCAGMNRFGFLPFGGLLCCILALADLGKVTPMNALKLRLVQILPIWMAAGHCAYHNQITLDRLEDLTLVIFAAGGIFTIAALFIDFVGSKNSLGKWLTRLYALRLVIPLTMLTMTAFVLVAGMDRSNVPMILEGVANYMSWPVLLLAACGAFIFFSGRPALNDHLFALVTFLGCATVLVILQSEIAPLMPWASRRLMMYTVPLAALLAGISLLQCKRMHILVSVGVTIVLLALNLPKNWDALNTHEYVGISQHLGEVAEQIQPEDLVVADHFLWSTPLRLIHGKNVINGEVLWQEDTSDLHHRPRDERFEKAMTVLRRFQAEGKTIRFLSSTDKLTNVYPGEIPATQDWQGAPIDYTLIAHHNRTAGFKHHNRRKRFTLHTLNSP